MQQCVCESYDSMLAILVFTRILVKVKAGVNMSRRRFTANQNWIEFVALKLLRSPILKMNRAFFYASQKISDGPQWRLCSMDGRGWSNELSHDLRDDITYIFEDLDGALMLEGSLEVLYS